MDRLPRRLGVAALLTVLAFPGVDAAPTEPVEITDPDSDGGPGGLGVERVDISFVDWEHVGFAIRTEAPVEAVFPPNATHETRLAVWFGATVDRRNETRSCYVYASPYRHINETRWRAAGTCEWNGGPIYYEHPENETALRVTTEGAWVNITAPMHIMPGFVLDPGGDEINGPVAVVALVDRNAVDPYGQPPYNEKVWDRGPNEKYGAPWIPWHFPPVGTSFVLTAQTWAVGCSDTSVAIPMEGTIDLPLYITNRSPYEITVWLAANASHPDVQVELNTTEARVGHGEANVVALALGADRFIPQKTQIEVVARADAWTRVVRVDATVVPRNDYDHAADYPSTCGGDRGPESPVALPALGAVPIVLLLVTGLALGLLHRPEPPGPVRPPRPPASP